MLEGSLSQPGAIRARSWEDNSQVGIKDPKVEVRAGEANR